MPKLHLKIASLITVITLAIGVSPIHARIIFVDDVFENDSETYEIGANDDAAATTLILEFGGTNAESLTWNTSIFTLSDDLTVQGNIIGTDITANGTLDANGAVTLGDGGDDIAIDSDDWDITSAGVLNGFTGGDATTEDTIEGFIFDADAENITGVWEIQDNVNLNFGNDADISIQYDETTDDRLEITGANGVLIEKTGAGISLQVNDTASDTTPFVVNGSGEVGIGTSTPDRPFHIVRSGADFGLNYPGAHYESSGATGFGPSVNLDASSMTGGEEYYIASTGTSDVTGAGNLTFYDFGDASARFVLDTDGNISINGETNPASPFDVGGTGELIELGDGSANDFIINFDDGTDRNFGWDDSEGSLSTFDQELRFRTRQGATPPVACSSTVAGMQWLDTDTGITYTCDTSNSRNKWLSIGEQVMFGDESGSCAAGADANSNTNCNVDWGNGLGPDGSTNLGFYIPHPITITGYGFSADNDACTSGDFDVEVWSTGSNSDDDNYTFEADIASALDGQAHNSNASNVDIAGDQYTVWGIDNNCGQAIDDFNVVIYFRYRHN